MKIMQTVILLAFLAAALPAESTFDKLFPPGKGTPAPQWNTTLATTDELVAVINKWSSDIITDENFNLWEPIKLAALIDPYLHQVYGTLNEGDPDFDEFVKKLGMYAYKEVKHLQRLPVFKKEPGNMPWGKRNLFSPVYKRLLPSEMAAMSKYTDGEPAGACESLSYFFAGLLRLKGVDAADIVHLRMKDHTIAIAEYDGALYGINSNAVGRFNERIQAWHADQSYVGLFGEHFAGLGKLRLDEAFLRSAATDDKSLLKAFSPLAGNALTVNTRVSALIAAQAPPAADRPAMQKFLFEDLASVDERLSLLVRYAYQSLDVPDLYPYVEASLRGPLVKKLARTLKNTDKAAEWIEANIEKTSIFADGDERIMTADQVLVYGTGSERDRELLTYTLERLF